MINGWGRYGKYETKLYKPNNINSIKKIINNSSHDTFICRGLGRSYGDSSINSKVIDISNIKKNVKYQKRKKKFIVQVIFQLKNFYRNY